MERMTLPLSGVGLKLAAGEAMTFSGYGAVFGNVDAYGDVIEAGAFAATLREAKSSGRWPAMLSQHGGFTSEDMTPVGIWTALEEDATGLRVEGKLAPTPRGSELHTLMKMEPRPAIDGLSIGYIAKEWVSRSKPDEPRRVLKRIDLIEISPVTFPANGKARVSSVKAGGMNEREFERLLRDAGLSRGEAKAFIAEGFKGLRSLRDAGDEGGDELAAMIRRNIESMKGAHL